MKAPLCAATGVAELWIVDLAGRAIEVQRAPSPDGYADQHRLATPGDRLSPAAFSDISLTLEDVLGPPT